MLTTDHHNIQIIMVSYHRPQDLRLSIQSIIDNTDNNYQLSIIDNSCGAIDSTLDIYRDKATIYKNTTNLGKGKAFMKWYPVIVGRSIAKYFISIDSDIVVPQNWLMKFCVAANRVQLTTKLAAIGATIINDRNDSFQEQFKKQHLLMHRLPKNPIFHQNILELRHLAGSLLLINRSFFDKIGGYCQTQLYGNDDGELCKIAHRLGYFTGMLTDLAVLHSNLDSSDGYKEWKKRNVNKDADGTGYWDQLDNRNNT